MLPALAALVLLGDDELEDTASKLGLALADAAGVEDPESARPKPKFCANHADGETLATWKCPSCPEQLRYFCDAWNTSSHLRRTVLPGIDKVGSLPPLEHERVAVAPCSELSDLVPEITRDGSQTKVRLSWLTVTVDNTLSRAAVTLNTDRLPDFFGGGAASATPKCRFCLADVPLKPFQAAATGNASPVVCDECTEFTEFACTKIHAGCGHICGGVKGEARCLPCLHGGPMCGGATDASKDSQKGGKAKTERTDPCSTCWGALHEAPVIELDCGHFTHLHCVKGMLKARWAGWRITFRYACCTICSAPLSVAKTNPELDASLFTEARELEEKVRAKALMRCKYEGLDKDPEFLNDKEGRFDNDLATYAMHRLAYYMCHKCQSPYFGVDARRCGAGNADFKPEELVCGGCVPLAGGVSKCKKHGTDYLEWKCRFCCSVAVFFCFGTTHFCDTCHDNYSKMQRLQREEKLPCFPAAPNGVQLKAGTPCPLGILHPAPGEEFPLGCGLCRNEHTF